MQFLFWKRRNMDTDSKLLYRKYTVDIAFVNGLAGGRPAAPGLVADHIKLFSEGVSNALKYAKNVEGEVTEEAAAAYMMKCSAVFPVDIQGIYVGGFQLNAMLKDAAQRMKATMKTKGLGHTIRDGGVVFPRRIYLGQEPKLVERPIKPDNSAQASIKLFQVAEDVKLTIPCAVIENGDLPDQLWQQIWQVAQAIGLGAQRHLDYGAFEVTRNEQEGHWESIGPLLHAGGYNCDGTQMGNGKKANGAKRAK